MTEVSPTPASPADRFGCVTPYDVYGELAVGGGISVTEWAGGDLRSAAKRLGDKEGVLLLHLDRDEVDGAPYDEVSVHPDESDRLDLFDRAIRALENAREALKACGYVDNTERLSGRLVCEVEAFTTRRAQR